MDSLKINNNHVAGNINALLDTGTTLLEFPYDFIQNGFDQILKQVGIHCGVLKADRIGRTNRMYCRFNDKNEGKKLYFDFIFKGVEFRITWDNLTSICRPSREFPGMEFCWMSVEFIRGKRSVMIGKILL